MSVPPGPPPGPPPLDGDVDRGVRLVAIYSVECGIALGFLLLRTWARVLVRGFGMDDYIMYFTGIVFVALTIIVGFLGSHGGTRHAYYLSPSEASYAVKLNYIAQPFGIVAVGMGKISVAFILLRIIGNTSFWRRWSLWSIVVLTLISTVLAAIFTFTQCNPPATLWTPELRPTAHCWEPSVQANYSIFSSSWNTAVDFMLALLPIPTIYHLQISRGQKLSLGVLLGLGIFTGICAAIKTNQLQNLGARSDLAYATYGLYTWASAEIFLVIVLGSVPTMKPLWHRFMGKNTTSKLYYHPTDENHILVTRTFGTGSEV